MKPDKYLLLDVQKQKRKKSNSDFSENVHVPETTTKEGI